VVVPSSDSKGNADALARFILGDTTATGARNNINRVYKLTRGEIYLLTGRVYCQFPLTLIADDNNTKQLPVIAAFPIADGSVARISLYLYQNSKLKNIYFQGMSPATTRNSGDRPFVLAGNNMRVEADNLIVEAFLSGGPSNAGSNNSLFMTNCELRNINNKSQFNGNFFYNGGQNMDTVSIVNCTFFNAASYFLCCSKQFTNFVRFEHNTLFINQDNPFYVPFLSKGVIKNNILYSPAICGELPSERRDGYYDWDNEHLAVFSIDTIPTDMATQFKISESDRCIDFSNNAYFWPQKIKDYWKTIDSLTPPVWMNERTKAMFNDKVHYPHLTANNNIEADPGFNSSVMVMVDSALTNIMTLRSGGKTHYYFFNPSGETIFPCRFPLPEKLNYTNTTLQAAAEGGFPLGDLNWYPEKKAQWKTWITDVEKTPAKVPNNYSLEQNYPNPFNPSTIIKFQLSKAGMTTLKVYDILGKVVTTLINKEMPEGTHMATFNAAGLPSGIYFYRLESGSFSSVKKLMLIK
jgi:hypothetical protein